MIAFGVMVGITLVSMFVGIYFGGRHTLRNWGYDCPLRGEMVKTDKRVNLQS